MPRPIVESSLQQVEAAVMEAAMHDQLDKKRVDVAIGAAEALVAGGLPGDLVSRSLIEVTGARRVQGDLAKSIVE